MVRNKMYNWVLLTGGWQFMVHASLWWCSPSHWGLAAGTSRMGWLMLISPVPGQMRSAMSARLKTEPFVVGPPNVFYILIQWQWRMTNNNPLTVKSGKVFENSVMDTVWSKKGFNAAVAPALIVTASSAFREPWNWVLMSSRETRGWSPVPEMRVAFLVTDSLKSMPADPSTFRNTVALASPSRISTPISICAF